jgi:hypothetical protein
MFRHRKRLIASKLSYNIRKTLQIDEKEKLKKNEANVYGVYIITVARNSKFESSAGGLKQRRGVD